MSVPIEDIVRPLVPANEQPLTSYEERYGVRFKEANSHQMDSFYEILKSVIAIRVDAAGIMQYADVPIGPARYYKPGAFLAEPLDSNQRNAINSGETPAIARYCLDVQNKLAHVPIIESSEPMLHLPRLLESLGVTATFSDLPFHEACGKWAGQPRQFWVREGLGKRLGLFGKVLNSLGLSPHFEDAFRPVGVQEGLFRRRMAWTRRDYPHWSEDEWLAETQSKTATTPRLASHKAGAAVDARMKSLEDGTILDFGHDYPDGGAIVYPQSPFVTAEQWRNRQIFRVAAELCDLTLYVGEDWHLSFGDNLASLGANGQVAPGYTASYGPIKAFDQSSSPGKILEIYTEGELDRHFDY